MSVENRGPRMPQQQQQQQQQQQPGPFRQQYRPPRNYNNDNYNGSQFSDSNNQGAADTFSQRRPQRGPRNNGARELNNGMPQQMGSGSGYVIRQLA